jgi:hypothetical protein
MTLYEKKEREVQTPPLEMVLSGDEQLYESNPHYTD